MTALTHSLGTGFTDFGHALADLCLTFARAIAAAGDYRTLESMTDAQLATRGLSRSDLPALVFQRHFD